MQCEPSSRLRPAYLIFPVSRVLQHVREREHE